ncbi:cytochrome c oxidase subunit 5b-1, mitochondrial-like [Syzygium oleosum]|uniref:cytochrome c oxidase subunit 5b-1, mitochondrial-like n=1 Tax=Syzygium oleosum TaxID=219896 RepID=UPI0011D29131|nr:cytochrome c oxidase subunit 5b-1, mitochondrial-like [Syzygium oleosum]
MWRRLASSHLKTLAAAAASSSSAPRRSSAAAAASSPARLFGSPPLISRPLLRSCSSSLLARRFSVESGETAVKKKVEDVMPIATGHEREELEAELEGRDVLDINFPVGPFGTKESPAVVKSYYDKRIVGCPGGEGEDEHDVVWFWLEKGKPHECPVCAQYFVLEVVGPGGPPDGHDDEDHHH